MKYIASSALVLALLMKSSQAIRIRDIGDIELPEIKDMNDIMLDKEITKQTS